jgi:hypothetical protein
MRRIWSCLAVILACSNRLFDSGYYMIAYKSYSTNSFCSIHKLFFRQSLINVHFVAYRQRSQRIVFGIFYGVCPLQFVDGQLNSMSLGNMLIAKYILRRQNV